MSLRALVLLALAFPGVSRGATGQKTGSSAVNATAQDVSDRSVKATGSSAGRALKDRFADVVNVRDFGAKGDGSTDDTAALNLAGASGKLVLFPPGTYKATATVQLSAANTRFLGSSPDGAVISFSGPTASAYALQLIGSGSGVEGLGINIVSGDWRRGVDMRTSKTFVRRCRFNVTTTDTTAALYVIFASQGAGNPMTGLRIEDNEITGSGFMGGDGVQASYVPGIRVTGNWIHDLAISNPTQFSWGIYVAAGAQGALIEGNHVVDTNTGGIHLNAQGDSVDRGRRMIGNRIENVAYVGLGADYTSGVVIANNSVAKCDLPVAVTNGANALIQGNQIDTVVSLGSPLNSARPFVAVTAPGSIVTGNVFGARGNALVGVDVEADSISVTFNQFAGDRPGQAVLATSTATHALVASNVVQLTTDTPTNLAALEIDGANSLVATNQIQMGADGYGIRIGHNGCGVVGNWSNGGLNLVYVPATVANTGIYNNIASDFSSAAFNDLGTKTTKRDNLIQWYATSGAGRATFSGTGAQTDFVIAHGLTTTPKSATVTPASSAAVGDFFVSVNTTSITVTYSVAPANGTNNVVLNWSADSN